VTKPTHEKLNRGQLRACIWFGELILRGAVNLAKLNEQSHVLSENNRQGVKRKRDNDVLAAGSSRYPPSPPAKKTRSSNTGPPQTPTTASLLFKIERSSQTSFQKRVLSALLQIPTGHYTTYAILAKFLKSSARAVGNALSTNPFTPNVPCHRVLASGGGIGGFKGVWGRHGREGTNDDEKRRLLRAEGVKFDGRGRVLGSSWEGFR
jgi:O-6-methylguanine DNA methyltransferase